MINIHFNNNINHPFVYLQIFNNNNSNKIIDYTKCLENRRKNGTELIETVLLYNIVKINNLYKLNSEDILVIYNEIDLALEWSRKLMYENIIDDFKNEFYYNYLGLKGDILYLDKQINNIIYNTKLPGHFIKILSIKIIKSRFIVTNLLNIEINTIY